MAIRTALERILDDCPAWLRGLRVGLLTNHAGLDRTLRPGAERLLAQGDVRLERLFSPEHGLGGDAPDRAPVGDRVDRASGLPVVSLFRAERERSRASAAMVAGLDAVLVDLQDIGSRYYTYPATALDLLAACHEVGVTMAVLDRPNPLGGRFEGQRAVAPALRSLVGALPVPMRHGLTIAELLRLGAREAGIEDALRIVPMDGWRRSLRWPNLDRPWVPLSPAANSFDMALVYPGTCLFEGTNLSEGRGTTLPFVQVGAPWLDGHALVRAVESRLGDGMRVRPVTFRPDADKHSGQVCGGVMFHAEPGVDAATVGPALHILRAALADPSSAILAGRADDVYDAPWLDLLAGNPELRADLEAGRDVDDILDDWEHALTDWPEVMASVSLYPA